MVEAVAGGVRQSSAYYSSNMNLRLLENYGGSSIAFLPIFFSSSYFFFWFFLSSVPRSAGLKLAIVNAALLGAPDVFFVFACILFFFSSSLDAAPERKIAFYYRPKFFFSRANGNGTESSPETLVLFPPWRQATHAQPQTLTALSWARRLQPKQEQTGYDATPPITLLFNRRMSYVRY